jgi:hypothetical protein
MNRRWDDVVNDIAVFMGMLVLLLSSIMLCLIVGWLGWHLISQGGGDGERYTIEFAGKGNDVALAGINLTGQVEVVLRTFDDGAGKRDCVHGVPYVAPVALPLILGH